MLSLMRLFCASYLALLWSAGLLRAAPADDGLYATLQTTVGEICFELYFNETPRTCANFVGLAEGSRAWLDPRNGTVRTDPFYDGIVFHRTIEGFMIQGGSPNGDGRDGPGYVFSDEFHPALRHDAAGTVSMANSGPNSNGSQFFLTVTNTPWLDDAHTVFGRVVEGMDRVFAISESETDADDRPLVDVVITNAFITRRGAAAEAFDIHAVDPSLPLVRTVATDIYPVEGSLIVDWQEQAHAAYWIYGTENLLAGTWADLVGSHVTWASADATGIRNSYPRYFFNVTEVEYFE